MKNDNLDNLVQKYMEAESGLEEENQLKTALSAKDVPEQYSDLQALFGYFELQKSHTVIPEFKNPTQEIKPASGKIINLRWIAAAASIAILVVAVYMFTQKPDPHNLDTFSDPAMAAESALEALQLLSGELNRGQDIAREQMKEFDNFNKYLNVY
ncbi:MAG TPA: hypothetical protein VKZ54_03185 [Membranihabitans sp.]|nr:hypothetical protein [Membranihabitans sp.]